MWTQDLYLKALHFAAEAHKEQKFPGTDYSYVVHLTSVCMEIMAALPHSPDMDGDLAVQCALLHDTIEDTDVTYDQLTAEFGKEVADGVSALTKNEELPKEEQMADSLARLKQAPFSVGAVKLADRISNLRKPPHYWSREKTAAYRREGELILGALASCNPFLAERLRKKIADYGKYLS